MNLTLDRRWEDFVEEQVRSGRYRSADEVVSEGLRLVQEQEAKLNALRAAIDESLAREGSNTDEGVDRRLATTAEELRRQGY